MNRICVIGHYKDDGSLKDGQSIKTYEFVKELSKHTRVLVCSTYCWKRRPISFLLKMITSIIKSRDIIMITAQNGVKILIPLLGIFTFFTRKNMQYLVVGGWLPEMLKVKPITRKLLHKFSSIYVETNILMSRMRTLGYNNVSVLKNFKNLELCHNKYIDVEVVSSFSFVIMSRIIEKKGILDAISAIKTLNTTEVPNSFLDIYGPISEEFESNFWDALNDAKPYVSYKGVVEPKNTSRVLSNYYALLFPTKFYTEGVPGTIIDSYHSGTPVIASNWESCLDVVRDNHTGLVYEFNKPEELLEKMRFSIQNVEIITSMRQNCYKEAKLYSSSFVIENYIKENLGD